MARSNRCFALVAAHKPRVRSFHARARLSVRAWSARACVLRAGATALRRFDRVIAQMSKQNAAQ
eukprot:1728477-Lingulodinium_polyedra.AAC.1